MFPVERKNEFLRYVMITEPYDKWYEVVFNYMKENNIKNWKEGFDFITEHSSNPPWFAYWMVRDGHAEPEWAKETIENTIIGNPPVAAYWMVEDGYAELKWAMKVIENATIGDPSRAAYFMVKYGFAESEWTRKVIENATSGSYQSVIAHLMVRYGYATKEWCQEIERKSNVSS